MKRCRHRFIKVQGVDWCVKCGTLRIRFIPDTELTHPHTYQKFFYKYPVCTFLTRLNPDKEG